MIDVKNMTPNETEAYEAGCRTGAKGECDRISYGIKDRLIALERLAKSAIDDANRADGYTVEFWKNVAATHQRELRSLQKILDEVVNQEPF